MTEDQSDAILSALTRIADSLDRIEGRLARKGEDWPECEGGILGKGAKVTPVKMEDAYFSVASYDKLAPIPMDKSAVKFDADDAR